jgi:hypothetical protein
VRLERGLHPRPKLSRSACLQPFGYQLQGRSICLESVGYISIALLRIACKSAQQTPAISRVSLSYFGGTSQKGALDNAYFGPSEVTAPFPRQPIVGLYKILGQDRLDMLRFAQEPVYPAHAYASLQGILCRMLFRLDDRSKSW